MVIRREAQKKKTRRSPYSSRGANGRAMRSEDAEAEEKNGAGGGGGVAVALGDRKCVKLQRSAILMTPNDMPPS